MVDEAEVTFKPSNMLDTTTEYVVTLATTICDMAGNHLEESFTSSFTTSGLPVADAGGDKIVNRKETVTLDASGSWGPSGGELTYSWTQLSGPSIPALSGGAPSFNAPDEIASLVFALVVSEDGLESEPTNVRVLVAEDKNHAFFVHPNGSDENNGSIDRPFVTVQRAIDAAHAENAGGDVYIAAGEYLESVTLETGISLYGGYDADSWERDETSYVTHILGGTTSVKGTNANSLTLDGLHIESSSATDPGEASIALVLDACTDVAVRYSTLTSGNGAGGLMGGPGAQGRVGLGGSNGTRPTGGNGGVGYGHQGGRGGNGGTGAGNYSGDRGTAGGAQEDSLRAAGGAAGTHCTGCCGRSGHAGENGLDGEAGANGAGGAALGAFLSASYITANGEDGHVFHGGGGGGGGGGYAACEYDGGGGGGGGGGGEGGGGGQGGSGGGAAVGILLVNGSDVAIEYVTINTGNGGRGGAGGIGGEGGTGGAGGSGGNGHLNSGNGGAGGAGGKGGNGGYGGGGGGGPVLGIYQYQSNSSRTFVKFNLGTPGTGGARGDGYGNSGKDGELAEFRADI